MAKTVFQEQDDYKEWNDKISQSGEAPLAYACEPPEVEKWQHEVRQMLENSEFEKAMEALEQKLDDEPECGWAYYYQLLASNRKRNTANMAESPAKEFCNGFENNLYYKRAERFSDDYLKLELTYLSLIHHSFYLLNIAKIKIDEGDWKEAERCCQGIKESLFDYRNTDDVLECAQALGRRQELTEEYKKRVGNGHGYLQQEVKARNPKEYEEYCEMNRKSQEGWKKAKDNEAPKRFQLNLAALMVSLIILFTGFMHTGEAIYFLWAVLLAMALNSWFDEESIIRCIVLAVGLCVGVLLIAALLDMYTPNIVIVLVTGIFFFIHSKQNSGHKEFKACEERKQQIFDTVIKPLEDVIRQELHDEYEQYMNQADLISIRKWKL